MSQTITADKPRRIKPTTLAAIGFAAPLIIYMLIFYVWPLIQNISMSMHRYTRRTFVTGDAPWSGFDIYKEILSNQQFWTILGQTLIFVFASIVFQYSIGLALAVFFNQNFKLSAALRGAFLVPWLLPPMISGTIWQWMMDADSGVINNFLKLFGLDPVWWLQADHSLWAVIIANIWLGIPFNLVILYSGLQNINGDLYEAAALDGCNAWQRFWKITFPLLKPVSMITLLLGFVYTLRTVDIIWIMTKGTGSSRTLATWAYEMAFGKGTSATIRYSEASVVGTILIVVALIFALIYLWAQRNEEKRYLNETSFIMVENTYRHHFDADYALPRILDDQHIIHATSLHPFRGSVPERFHARQLCLCVKFTAPLPRNVIASCHRMRDPDSSNCITFVIRHCFLGVQRLKVHELPVDCCSDDSRGRYVSRLLPDLQ